MLWLYLLTLLALAAALWGVYRVLGTPSKLPPTDYQIVLADVAVSVEKAATQLRQTLDGSPTADWAVAVRPASRFVVGRQPITFSIFRASTTERCCSPASAGP